MNNVYALVEHFYEKNIDAEFIVSQETIEKYLRRKAWQGADDDTLKEIWSILSLLVLSVEQMNLYSLASLTPYDYQEIFYRYKQKNKEFQLDETSINRFLSIAEAFFSYLAAFADEEDYRPYLQEAKKALYDDGSFFLPPRRSADEFYRSLEHMVEVSPEAMQQLNHLLDSLLHRVHSYYRDARFKADIDRAALMYVGPEYEEKVDKDLFWQGFWDFFLFDYHLLATDDVPLRHYYEQKKEELTTSEQDVLRDLLRSEFTVFSIVSFDEEFVTCQNLFTDERMYLPLPEMASPAFENCLLYGHVHSRGVMLLNYITSIPASNKLKKRMRDMVLRQYELFKFQLPVASLKDFFGREAGAVRHTLQILSGFAQLSLLPMRSIANPLPKNYALAERYADEEKELCHYGSQFGYGKFELALLLKLFEDYLEVRARRYGIKQMDAVMTAALLEFAAINGTDLSDIPDMYEFLGAERQAVTGHMKAMQDVLGCLPFDPRYLSEDGFIRALYY